MKTADEIGKAFDDNAREMYWPKSTDEFESIPMDSRAPMIMQRNAFIETVTALMFEAESKFDALTAELEESKRQHKDAVLALANITDTLEELARELGEESQEAQS